MSLPGDTIRVLSFDELPPSVREIPSTNNPLADGVLMKHQRDWLKLCSEQDLTIAEKGRRTGITYATALDGSITAASRKSAGGDNVYYVGDTKEKGLEFIGYCAHMSKVMAMAMADGWNGIEVFLFEDQQEDGSSKHITAYRIRYGSGYQIVALSSNPANIRGLQGIVVIDEAAFHANVQAVIEACLALIIWGGKIRIISTHNGAANPFNELIKESRLGNYDFKVFNVFFDDAVANGLYERVCFVKGWQPSEDGKRKWYNKVRGAYGSNRSAMLEELDGVPRDGSGVAIPGLLIENCMHEARPVLRLALDDIFASQSVAYRESWCNDWIKEHLQPLLDALDQTIEYTIGEDFARHGDFSIISPMAILKNLTRKVPFLVEMKNVPTRQQEQILWHIIDNIKKLRRAKMDATGNGATLAEYTADKYGRHVIDEVMISETWYRENMVKFQKAFEDQELDLPKDADIKNDIRALQLINGVIKLPSLRTQDTKNKEFKRHGDAAIAIALAYLATLEDIAPIEYTAAPDKSSRWDPDPNNDNDYNYGGKGAW